MFNYTATAVVNESSESLLLMLEYSKNVKWNAHAAIDENLARCLGVSADVLLWSVFCVSKWSHVNGFRDAFDCVIFGCVDHELGAWSILANVLNSSRFSFLITSEINDCSWILGVSITALIARKHCSVQRARAESMNPPRRRLNICF